MPAGWPIIHTTPEAKLAAEREKQRNYYARHKASINLKRQLASHHMPNTCKMDSQAIDVLEADTAHDLSPEPKTLSDCLGIVRDAKNKLVALAPTPIAYVEQLLHKYVASVPDATDGEATSGDISIIKDAIQTIGSIHDKAHHGHDRIWDICGVCDEWRATEEDILWYLNISYGELAYAFVAKELMYQNDDDLSL
ncbi:hypothetical protein DFJ58DRAFT_735265 [Suillus subalutaceus]|uniref:uncharacterized protein n=1 Tax=Suillus subalutaceus TaxID=48586 RepID=UPI001B861572|nr:uncharacterized protein DFJ58DRAFT_735265 [Suillus subalutaceus]KAG1836052.1 hypothetical protein DFJ58DRAFT_735265 [Suillus subalutaceus]